MAERFDSEDDYAWLRACEIGVLETSESIELQALAEKISAGIRITDTLADFALTYVRTHPDKYVFAQSFRMAASHLWNKPALDLVKCVARHSRDLDEGFDLQRVEDALMSMTEKARSSRIDVTDNATMLNVTVNTAPLLQGDGLDFFRSLPQMVDPCAPRAKISQPALRPDGQL